MRSIYVAGILNPNSWYTSCGHLEIKAQCKHRHTTISGAVRCLDQLAQYYPDGSHNGWAHFGDVYTLSPVCGCVVGLSENDHQKLEHILQPE